MTRTEALDALLAGTHTFWTPKFVDEINAAFGTKLRCHVFHANPKDPKGLTLNDGADSARGLDSRTIATALCHHFNVTFDAKFGRGSQVRACVDALRAAGHGV